MSHGESDPNRAKITIAEAQGGFITRRQLLRLGFGPGQIKAQLRIGALRPYLPGVYAIGHVPTRPEARAFGAQLAVGDHSALAGGSACA